MRIAALHRRVLSQLTPRSADEVIALGSMPSCRQRASRRALREKGIRLAQKMQVDPNIPAGMHP
jgi:hypothetical protein